MLRQLAGAAERCGVGEEALEPRVRRRRDAAHVGDRVAPIAVGVAGAGGHDDGLVRAGADPRLAGEELGAAVEHREALLHRRVDVRRHAAAGLDPHLDMDGLAAVRLGDPLEPKPVLEDGVLDDLGLHVVSVRLARKLVTTRNVLRER